MNDTSDGQTRAARRTGRMDAVRAGVILALIAVVVGLAVDNRQKVSVGWLVGDDEIPLYLVFVATFVAGVLVGLIARRRHRHH